MSPKAKSPPYRWVCYADGRYITARFLYWKGMLDDFALVGAHAFEMYLKAFIAHKTGSFSSTHNLQQLCQTCGKYDPFFLTLLGSPDWSRTWPVYWGFLRYPEPLPSVGSPPTVMAVGFDNLRQLDSLAAHVKSCVPNPAPAGSHYGDVVLSVIRRTRPISGLVPITCEEDLDEVRVLLLRENEYFSE